MNEQHSSTASTGLMDQVRRGATSQLSTQKNKATDGIGTVAELVGWLKSRGPEYEAAFAKPGVVRAAVNQAHVQPTASIAGAREIAFFPPVTGG